MSSPGIPTGFIAQQGNGQVYLSWNISAGATSYPVYRSVDNVTFTLLAAAAVNDYLDTTVVLNTQYYYKVSASNGSESPQTESAGVVPTLTGILSLGQLRLNSQQRADRVNSNFVTKSEWNSYITQSAFELYDMLVTAYEDYFLAPVYEFVTNGIDDAFPMPTDLYKLMGVDIGLGNQTNAYVTIKKFQFIERNRYVYPNISSTFLGVFNARYRLMGSNLQFIPTPSAGQAIRVWYIPKLVQPLKDTDVINGISGWTEYVIVDAAIKALQKEESDTSILMAQKMALKQRIEEAAQNRDAGEPDVISRTREETNGWGPGDGSYGGW